MSWSRGRVVLPAAIALMSAPAAWAVDATRLDLLAGEAVSVMGNAAAAPSRIGLVVLIAIPVATMLSAFLGTFLGIRGLSFSSLRDRDGWREVAYRFRSEEPMTVGKDVIHRMSGVLDDIEELGRNIRTRAAKPAEPVPVGTTPVEPATVGTATTAADPAREKAARGKAPRDAKGPGLWAGRNGGRKEAPPVEPVTFLRREEPALAAASFAVPEPPPAVAVAPPPQPIARATGDDTDRSARYRRARALLEQGHDREAVRSMTGLKLAEVDLLRCAGAPGGPS